MRRGMKAFCSYCTLAAAILFISLYAIAGIAQPSGSSSTTQDFDYSAATSYSDPDFYSDSDPSQWDYSKIDYSMADYSKMDQSRIDTAKYMQDLGCDSCSFDKGTVQGLKFTKTGITHPGGDSVTVKGYPKGTVFIAQKDHIEVKFDSVDSSVDSITLPKGDDVLVNTGMTKGGEDSTVYDSEGPITDSVGRIVNIDGADVIGEVVVKDGVWTVKQGDIAFIDNIGVTSAYGDVQVYFDGSDDHDGNFISFGEDSFYASGTDMKVEFLYGNDYLTGGNPRYHQVSKDAHYTQQQFLTEILEEGENDFLEFSIDDGSFRVQSRDDENNLPFIQTDGTLKVTDDANSVVIDGTDVRCSADKYNEGTGSVFFELEAGGDETVHWFFDDNRNIIAHSRESDSRAIGYEEMAVKRKQLKDVYNVDLKGYFSGGELTQFDENLKKLSDGGALVYPLTIYSVDRYWLAKDVEAGTMPELSADTIFWTPVYDLKGQKEYPVTGLMSDISDKEANYERSIIHEYGHILSDSGSEANHIYKVDGKPITTYSAWTEVSHDRLALDTDWDKDTFEGHWIEALEQYTDVIETEKNQPFGNTNPAKFAFGTTGDDGLMADAVFSGIFTSRGTGMAYAKTSVAESQAEVFAQMLLYPDWFTDTSTVQGDLPEGKTKEDILKIRQDLRQKYLDLISSSKR